MIKPLFVAAAILGLIMIIKKYKNNLPKFIILSAIGLFISAFILSTSTKFAEVIMYEQNVYAERVLELMLVLLIPGFVLGLREFFIRIKKHGSKQFMTALFFSFLLLISWYFTYPTRDAVAFHTGWSVRGADITTVHFIDNLNQNKKDYIVIANQLLGAAALQEFGFEKYLLKAMSLNLSTSLPDKYLVGRGKVSYAYCEYPCHTSGNCHPCFNA